MEQKDRGHYHVRMFRLGDPEQDYEPAIADLTPSERIALVIKLSEMAYPPDLQNANMTAVQRREARIDWPVKKYFRS